MAVLFAWNQRPLEKISFEDLRCVFAAVHIILHLLYSMMCLVQLKLFMLQCVVDTLGLLQS